MTKDWCQTRNCCCYWRRILQKTQNFRMKNTRGLVSKVSRNPSACPCLELKKKDLPVLADALQLPETFHCNQRTTADKLEGLCTLLRRMSFPYRYSDMIARFGRPVPELTFTMYMAKNCVNGIVILNPRYSDTYTDAISNKGAALQNFFGFIDGTVRPICRPSQEQRIMFNGHKRVHSLKFQSVTLPNGLIANLLGPVG